MDGYLCDPIVLSSKRRTEIFLKLLMKKLGMRKLYGPAVVHAKGNDKKDPGGWSGFLMIQESHFSVHTFPKRKFVSIDVYSCKDFDFKSATKFIEKFFRARTIETNVIVRGRRYPQKNLL